MSSLDGTNISDSIVEVMQPETTTISTSTQSSSAAKQQQRLCCSVCRKVFQRPHSCRVHMKQMHGLETPPCQIKTFTCAHKDCDVKLITLKSYRQHLRDAHQESNATDCIQFAFRNSVEFNAWKEEMETRDCAKYIKKTRPCRRNYSSTTVYSCHRSGSYVSQSTGKRQLKSQGSCKTGQHCPAEIVLVERDGRMVASYYSKHYGHDTSLGHLTIPASDRKEIADQLSKGIPVGKILLGLQGPACSTVGRAQLATRKDIHNIRHAYNINSPSPPCSTDKSLSRNSLTNVKCRIRRLTNQIAALTDALQDDVPFSVRSTVMAHLRAAQRLLLIKTVNVKKPLPFSNRRVSSSKLPLSQVTPYTSQQIKRKPN